MIKSIDRVLLATAAVLLFAGGALHATAFGAAAASLSNAALPAFYAGSFKALWLIDSATLVCLGGLFAFICARPGIATRPVLVFLALIPAATAVLIYLFVGPFFPAHMLAAAAAAVVLAGLLWRAG